MLGGNGKIPSSKNKSLERAEMTHKEQLIMSIVNHYIAHLGGSLLSEEQFETLLSNYRADNASFVKYASRYFAEHTAVVEDRYLVFDNEQDVEGKYICEFTQWAERNGYLLTVVRRETKYPVHVPEAFDLAVFLSLNLGGTYDAR